MLGQFHKRITPKDISTINKLISRDEVDEEETYLFRWDEETEQVIPIIGKLKFIFNEIVSENEEETLMESSSVLVANKLALQDDELKEKIFDILTLLKGVVDGSKRIHIFVNVKKSNLQKLLDEMPALKNPTIAPLADKSWVSVNTILEKNCFIRLLPRIRKLAQGIVVYEPRQVLALDEVTRREEKRCQS